MGRVGGDVGLAFDASGIGPAARAAWRKRTKSFSPRQSQPHKTSPNTCPPDACP
jgi:hypothetical protein